MKWVDTGSERYKFVWDGDEREEVTSGVLRRLIMQQQSFYTCHFCKKEHVCKFQGMACDDCLHSEEYKKQVIQPTESVRIKTYRDAVAFGYDTRTGRPLAIDANGRKFDEKDSIYGRNKDDQHGWRTIGRKVRETKYGQR